MIKPWERELRGIPKRNTVGTRQIIKDPRYNARSAKGEASTISPLASRIKEAKKPLALHLRATESYQLELNRHALLFLSFCRTFQLLPRFFQFLVYNVFESVKWRTSGIHNAIDHKRRCPVDADLNAVLHILFHLGLVL